MKEIRTAAIVGMGALGLLYGTHIVKAKGPEAVSYVMDEVEIFAGDVIRMGKELGVSTPANEDIYARVREIEAAYA